MSKEAMKLALEALEGLKSIPGGRHQLHELNALHRKHDRAIAAMREALAEQDSTCSNSLRAQGKAYPRTCKKCGLGPCVELAQQALDKKAENARELGLDYEPVNQEYERGVIDGMQEQMRRSVDRAVNAMAQRTWVGLSPADRGKCLSAGDAHGWIGVMEATEARLKELNT